MISCHSFSRLPSFAAHLRAPKWYKRPVGVSFGFGGKLVSFHPKSSVGGASTGSEVCITGAIHAFYYYGLWLIVSIYPGFGTQFGD